MWYENIQYNKSMPLKVLLVSAGQSGRSGDHWHNAIEIILVISGAINVMVEDESQILKTGDMLLINSNCRHCSEAVTGDGFHIVLQINPDFLSSYYENIKHYIKFSPEMQNERNRDVYCFIRSCVARIVLEYKDKKDAYEIAVIGLLNEMIALIIRFYPHYARDNSGYLMKEVNLKRLDRIMSYVDENYMKDIKIAELASQEYLSITYFSHFIKEYLGMSMRDYIMTKRIENAKFLILFSKKRISQISEECGFSKYQIFSKNFKKREGVSPSDYRRIYNSKIDSYEELCKTTYKYNDQFSNNLKSGLYGGTLQDFESNVGFAFDRWDIPIDWETLTEKIDRFVFSFDSYNR
jgi:AraC-type DNA-binding domain-containing proteins